MAITASVREQNSVVMGYEGIIKDITAAKHAQEQIEQERRLVASILELVPVAIFVVDKAHKVLPLEQGLRGAYRLEPPGCVGHR